jgi:hypothetical protein
VKFAVVRDQPTDLLRRIGTTMCGMLVALAFGGLLFQAPRSLARCAGQQLDFCYEAVFDKTQIGETEKGESND